jgi:hypothetical protein
MERHDILVLGMAPSLLKKGTKKGLSLERLQGWMDFCGFPEYDFHNIIQTPVTIPRMKNVSIELLHYAVNERRAVITLGTFVSSVCEKLGIDHYSLPHPSPRNRKFNDPDFEPKMLILLKEYLTMRLDQDDS